MLVSPHTPGHPIHDDPDCSYCHTILLSFLILSLLAYRLIAILCRNGYRLDRTRAELYILRFLPNCGKDNRRDQEYPGDECQRKPIVSAIVLSDTRLNGRIRRRQEIAQLIGEARERSTHSIG